MEIIVIVDYGMGNLNSVSKAMQYIVKGKQRVLTTSNPKEIYDSDKVIFPGQGAAESCMQNIKERNLEDAIIKSASEKPFLGICMGMQILMDKSSENNSTECLGIIKGEVKKLNSKNSSGEKIKIPHMGWNNIRQKTNHPIWHKIKDESFFYFVHSYFVEPSDKSIVVGTTQYDNEFCSVLAFENIVAIQGHPEKSSDVGLQLLKNFSNIKV
ncbi:MAG: imidazole glycerol phosphate synthase subunit HisH [Gammaproteobacteria bacterium]|nr:imidazole glycerol phosphate synthase subunit HisH [Gammaproteobacteria bacterium]